MCGVLTDACQNIAWSAAHTPFDAVRTIATPDKAGQALERFPIAWNHVIEKESLNSK